VRRCHQHHRPAQGRAAYRQCKEEALDNAITNFAVKMKAKQLAQR
jgi:hypothetical protein